MQGQRCIRSLENMAKGYAGTWKELWGENKTEDPFSLKDDERIGKIEKFLQTLLPILKGLCEYFDNYELQFW